MESPQSIDPDQRRPPEPCASTVPASERLPLKRPGRLLLTALGLWLCYLMAAPFLPAIALALALAVLFTPLQRWLETKLRRPNLAALITVLAIALVVVAPALLVGQQLALQAVDGAQLIDRKVSSGEWRRALETQPQLAPFIARIEQQVNLPGVVRSLTMQLSSSAAGFVKGSLYHLIGLTVTFYLLFFFLRDRREALTGLRHLSPLTASEMDELFARVGDTLHATVYGSLAVASLQGFLGGLMFWWLALPAPLLWGLVMALLAMVPVLGAFVVWTPAALFLLLEGSWGKALILALWGALVVGTSDNLLRPVLIGKRLRQHTLLAFMSVVGGILVFGAAGLILGPLALTVTTVLLETWQRRAASPA